MNNIQLFSFLNASGATPHWEIVAASAIAQWVIFAIPAAMTWSWVQGKEAGRIDLLEMLVTVMLALGAAQVITHMWPQPRPFMLHLGSQFLSHSSDPGLPSDHVTVFWSLACAAAVSRRHRRWALPLLSAGAAVGWSRVFLGIHFPFDVLAALPLAAAAAAVAVLARSALRPRYERIARTWDVVFAFRSLD